MVKRFPRRVCATSGPPFKERRPPLHKFTIWWNRLSDVDPAGPVLARPTPSRVVRFVLPLFILSLSDSFQFVLFFLNVIFLARLFLLLSFVV